jgi:hypothetical protein
MSVLPLKENDNHTDPFGNFWQESLKERSGYNI